MLATYGRLWRLLLARRATLGLALLGMAGAALATGLFAVLTGPALRLLFAGGSAPAWLGQGPWAPIGKWLLAQPPDRLRTDLPLLMFAVAAARAGFAYLQQSQMASLCLRAIADLQAALHRRLLTLSLAHFEGRHTGEVYSGFASDLVQVERALTQGLTYGLRDTFQLAALAAVSLALDWRLLLLGAVTLPIGVLAIAGFARALRRVSERMQARQASLVAQAQDLLSGATVLQIHVAQGAALRAQARSEDAFLAEGRPWAALRAAVTPTVEFLALAALALILVALRARWLSVAPDKLISFLGSVLLAYQPLKSVAASSQWLVPGLAAAEKLFAALDAPAEISDRPGAAPLRPTAAGLAIAFQCVGVRYRDRTALAEVSLEIPAGQKVAIVGPSGAGKSTLLHLVPRLLDPTSGAVRVGGQDTQALTLGSLRAAVGLVGQEVFLFDATVAETLDLGTAPLARADLEAALAAVEALEFVRALPEGLDTRLGERAGRLSGGQRQRLAIARALLKRAPILLLDEAMSAIEPPLEAAILGHLVADSKATLLLVTHRLATAALLDRVVVLADGRVIEDGPPAALRAGDGWFARAHRSQLGTA